MSTIHKKRFGLRSGSRVRRLIEAIKLNPLPRKREPRWVAWSGDLSKIVAYGATLEEARDAARAKGEMEPALEPVQSRYRLA